MGHGITYVGMDVHKRETKVAMVVGEEGREVQFSSKTDPARLAREIKKRAVAATKP